MRYRLGGALILVVAACLAACSPGPSVYTTVLNDGRSQVTVTLTDATGKVRSIDFVRPVPDWAFQPHPGQFPTTNDGPNTVWTTWVGGLCPTDVHIRAQSSADGIDLELDPGKKCDSDVGKVRVLAIHFTEAVPAESVRVLETAAP
ncbi:MAG: hypothetical protein WCK58_04565 [Chloroflexota bacterium]